MPALALRIGFFSALTGGFGAAFGFAGALRAVLRGFAAALSGAGLSAAGLFATALFAAAFFAAALGAFLPPPRAARASNSTTACSSVMVSGVMSEGRVALTPSWLA